MSILKSRPRKQILEQDSKAEEEEDDEDENGGEEVREEEERRSATDQSLKEIDKQTSEISILGTLPNEKIPELEFKCTKLSI